MVTLCRDTMLVARLLEHGWQGASGPLQAAAAATAAAQGWARRRVGGRVGRSPLPCSRQVGGAVEQRAPISTPTSGATHILPHGQCKHVGTGATAALNPRCFTLRSTAPKHLRST